MVLPDICWHKAKMFGAITRWKCYFCGILSSYSMRPKDVLIRGFVCLSVISIVLNANSPVMFGSYMPCSTPTTLLESQEIKASSNKTMGACVFVMDERIKLLEFIAYHYTVLPLGNLLIGINPNSRNVEIIEAIVDLWKDRMNIQLVHSDQYMVYGPTEGWINPARIRRGKTFENDVISSSWFHNKSSRQYLTISFRRDQAAFNIYCIQLMLNRSAGYTIVLDSDEYLVNNYFSTLENSSLYEYRRFKKGPRSTKGINRARAIAKPIREALPVMREHITMVELLSNFTGPTWATTPHCIRVASLPFLSFEGGRHQKPIVTPSFVNQDHLSTLRQTFHAHYDFGTTKAILNLDPHMFPPENATVKDFPSIHNPSIFACGPNLPHQTGTDYISSTWRLQHYRTGTIESVLERGSDYRMTNFDLVGFFKTRQTGPVVGQDFSIILWVEWFIAKVGEIESKRLLFTPLQEAYELMMNHSYKNFEQQLKINPRVQEWKE